MNVYKILIFDGFMAKEIIIGGLDIISAIQTNLGWDASRQIIKVELVGSQNQENHISYSSYPL